MDEEKYQKLLDAIQDSKRDVDSLEKKLLSSIDHLKYDVTDVQQKASQELAAKINKSSYQFRHKGNKVQHNFNSTIDESITAAKQELARLKPTEKGQQECLKKAEAHLDEGKKALEKRQKHIMVVDRSNYGWSTVQQYNINPLAADSEDEKRLEKTRKKLIWKIEAHECGV